MSVNPEKESIRRFSRASFKDPSSAVSDNGSSRYSALYQHHSYWHVGLSPRAHEILTDPVEALVPGVVAPRSVGPVMEGRL